MISSIVIIALIIVEFLMGWCIGKLRKQNDDIYHEFLNQRTHNNELSKLIRNLEKSDPFLSESERKEINEILTKRQSH